MFVFCQYIYCSQCIFTNAGCYVLAVGGLNIPHNAFLRKIVYNDVTSTLQARKVGGGRSVVAIFSSERSRH